MDWLRWENEWQARHHDVLQDYVSLANKVHNFVEHIATHQHIVSAEATESRMVERLLLRRLGEEFRSVDLLAMSGHGFQAMSASANVFEIVHTLVQITDNEVEAKRWLTSTDKKNGLWRIFDLVSENGKKLGWKKSRSDEEYNRYRFLCGFKHNTPVFTQFLQLPVDPDLHFAQFSIAESAHQTLIATSIVALFRLDNAEGLTAVAMANDLMDCATSAMPTLDHFSTGT